MNPRIPGALALATLVVSTLPGCNSGRADEASQPADPVAVPVAAGSPRIADIEASYETTGTLTATEEAPVPARVPGQVIDILVEEGDSVSEGQPLARFDGERARLIMLRAKADYEKTAREHRRLANLHERGLVSKASFESLEYDVEAAKAAFELARLDYEHSVVRATIDGVVSRRLIKPGSYVAEGDIAFVVTGTQTLHAYLDIPQTELAKFAPGHPASLAVAHAPGESFDAVVERISPTIDIDSGTFRATLAIDNGAGLLAPGMFARFAVAWQKREDAIVIPAGAAVIEDDESVVYVIENGAVRRRPVVLGLRSRGQVEVVEGLAAEERIVLSGQSRLRDGSRVVAQSTSDADSVIG